jgi:hypothetical protein
VSAASKRRARRANADSRRFAKDATRAGRRVALVDAHGDGEPASQKPPEEPPRPSAANQRPLEGRRRAAPREDQRCPRSIGRRAVLHFEPRRPRNTLAKARGVAPPEGPCLGSVSRWPAGVSPRRLSLRTALLPVPGCPGRLSQDHSPSRRRDQAEGPARAPPNIGATRAPDRRRRIDLGTTTGTGGAEPRPTKLTILNGVSDCPAIRVFQPYPSGPSGEPVARIPAASARRRWWSIRRPRSPSGDVRPSCSRVIHAIAGKSCDKRSRSRAGGSSGGRGRWAGGGRRGWAGGAAGTPPPIVASRCR